MTLPGNYDFSDPAVRDLVDLNHCPMEHVVTNTLGSYVELRCQQDGTLWPCAIIVARRAWQEPV